MQEKEQKSLDKNKKLNLLKTLEKTSSRECERILLELAPETPKEDKIRGITTDLTEIKITVDREFMGKVERLKNILSHSHPDISLKEMLDKALDELITKKDPALKKSKKQRTQVTLLSRKLKRKHSREGRSRHPHR